MTSQRVGHICVSFTAVFGKVRNLNVGTHRAHPDKISPYSVTYNREKLEVCGSQQTVENSSRDVNTRQPDLLLRNLYAGQEATVRTGHGTTDWFQIGKGCILSPCFFNFYVEYIMRNARLKENTSWNQDYWEKYQ